MNGAAPTSLTRAKISTCCPRCGARGSKAGEGRRHDRLFCELSPSQLTNNLAFGENQDPVTREQLGVFRRVPKQGATLPRELAAKAVKILLGGDIDATGRIVQKNDWGFGGDRPGYERLLLIAAAELENA